MSFRPAILLATCLWLTPMHGGAQKLALPLRPAGAPTGSQFVDIITPMARAERENWIFAQVLSGNVPDFQRSLAPVAVSATIGGTPHTALYYAAPDYLAIGTDADYFLQPTTPLLAQRLCDVLGCTLPTRKMVNQIWTNAPVKLQPVPFSPSTYDILSVEVFALSNDAIRSERDAQTNAHPLGTLTGGDKKDVVISSKIYTNLSTPPKPVVIYGWHYTTGVPIQGLVNVHEETYADYSHGARLVQNALTVDGSPNTITNVLTSSSLAALLSDEGPNEGTTSDGVIKTPRYTISGLPPVIITQPRVQTVLPGSSPAYRILVAGDPPLTYRWQRNGAVVPGGTSASLILSNIQSGNAGSYSVLISNLYGSVTSRLALLRVNTNVHPTLFADDFESATSTNWGLYWGAADGVADYSTNWAYDYGATAHTFNGVTGLIPPAPNSSEGSTKALRLTVNNNDSVGATAAVNLYPLGKFFSGNFALKFDLWINYPGGASGAGSTGSTEYAIFGVNHLGTQANWAAPSAASSDGVWFGVDGEGGSTTTDYRAYVGNTAGAPTDLTPSPASGLIASNNTAAIYQALFPSSGFETAGAPGKSWVEVEVRQTNNFISWIMNGTVVALRTNASPFTSGNLMIGFMDPFPSIANPAKSAFVLFDNLRVEDLDAPALQPPTISSQPTNLSTAAGSNATFGVVATGSSPLAFQWRRDGTAIAGATNSWLTLTNVQVANAGTYDAVVSNEAGLATSVSATLTVALPEFRFLSATVLPNAQVQLYFAGVPGQDYIIQASTNLVDWRPVSVLAATDGPLPFIDPDAANYSSRYYRARQAEGQTLTDFEVFASGAQVMFQPPSASGSTSAFLNAAPNLAYVTNSYPAGHSSARVLTAAWNFKTGTTGPWLRLTTFSAANLPNPTIGTNQALQFDAYADKALFVAVGFRETGTTAEVGADGGTSGTIEWIGGITDNLTNPPEGHYLAAGQWTTLTFLLSSEPVRGFTGNGILDTVTGRGVLEHLALVPASGPGTYILYLDNIRVVELGP